MTEEEFSAHSLGGYKRLPQPEKNVMKAAKKVNIKVCKYDYSKISHRRNISFKN